MRRWLLAWTLAAGCGRVGFDAIDARTDTPPDAFPTGPFGAPVALTDLNSTTATDDDPSMTADGLELYFASARTGAEYVYVTTRMTPAEAWAPPVRVSELDAGGSVNNPKVMPDGLTIFFSSGRAPSTSNALWFATRADRMQPWSGIARVTELDSAAPDYEPSCQTPLSIYFTSERGGGADPWIATRASTSDPFTGIHQLTELSGPGYDGSPFAIATDLLSLHQSDRNGNLDLYQATRDSSELPFGSIVPLTELNTPAFESDPWLSPDGHTILFSSTRNGNYDLFMATR